MAWNLANVDSTVALSLNVDSQQGNLNGTLTFKGTTYTVLGQWAASGLFGRAASAFRVWGSTQTNSPDFIAATGIITGHDDVATQIDIRVGATPSTDGSPDHYAGVLVPSIVDLKAPSSQPFLSGEITALQKLTATPPVAATIFNNSIVVLSDNTMSSFDLRKLVKSSTDESNGEPINSDALTLTSNWVNSADFSSIIQNNWRPDNLSRCSLATTPDAMYIFFNGRLNDSQAFVAYRNSLEQGLEQTPILLFKEPDTPLVPPAAKRGTKTNISTTVFGDNIIFFVCSQAVTFQDGGSEGTSTFIGMFDTGHQKVDDKGAIWPASWYRNLTAVDSWSNGIAIEWFSTVDQDGKPAFYLAVIASDLYSNSPNVNVVWYIPFTVTEDAHGQTVVVPSEPPMGRTMTHQAGEDDLIETLVRDPAGRVRGWARPSVKQPGPGLFSGHIMETLKPPTLDGPVVAPRLRERLPASDTMTAPSSLFYVFSPGATNTTFNGNKATDYPVYEFIFYGKSPTFQVNRYGTIQVVTGTDTQRLPPTPKYVIGGIIDGPIPIPIENYKDYYPNPPADISAGMLTYGSKSTDITSREVSNKQTVGFKTDGKATKGVGAAWDISFEGGSGSVKGNEEQQTLTYGLTQVATVTPQTHENPARINPNGTLQVLGIQFGLGAYRFIDMFGQPVSDATNSDSGQSPKAASIMMSLSNSGIRSYLPYAVTPGDLRSYTPEGINKTMKALSSTIKTPSYSGDNYYGDIICANAYQFKPNQAYLSFSWSEGSPFSEGFGDFQSSYTENSYSYDASVYMGISEGFGFEVFGMGEEQEAEFLGGMTFSHESTESENKESEWGIDLDKEWGPLLSEESDSVVSYDFRLYFLPVPKSPSTLSRSHWIEELKTYLPPGSDIQVDNIDPGSSCWRIVFVVTHIQYRNGLNNYDYDNHLDKPSVYANGNLLG